MNEIKDKIKYYGNAVLTGIANAIPGVGEVLGFYRAAKRGMSPEAAVGMVGVSTAGRLLGLFSGTPEGLALYVGLTSLPTISNIAGLDRLAYEYSRKGGEKI
jgi:hypothetical protein